ncbi:MAG: hypothetical protein QF918_08195 [Pirellulaceae bacterium]|nr:hypothetical protein [Planctomycetaceae bacterium]MDP6467705.1 hypothetical protein [Pirellulaceae bacterium]MDP6554023.1 hypothetical protein [Pirellulaceae bacterium]
MAASSRRKKSGKATSDGIGSLLGPVVSISPNLLLGVMLLLACTIGGVLGWKKWGKPALVQTATALRVDQISATRQPTWIKADVCSEAFRDGSLGELSSLDHELAYKVFRAFELHSWVAKVNRVNKGPKGRVDVDLRYRRPVAWVEIPSSMSPQDESGILPIDAEAVLLPPTDFQEAAIPMLRITIDELIPWGPVGTTWPDPRVVGAAQLAALVEGNWQQMQLHGIAIVAPPAEVRSSGPAVYELTTRSGHRFIWGSAPGREIVGEASTTQKIQLLRRLAAEMGATGPTQRWEIDLRNGERALSGARTASRANRQSR